MTLCKGCNIEYPDRLLDRIVNLTTSRICPICALYILKDVHGQQFEFSGDMNKANLKEARRVAGKRWKHPTEVE